MQTQDAQQNAKKRVNKPETPVPLDQIIPAVQALKTQPFFLGPIALAEIIPSKTNPRREFRDMEELTASIRRDGVLQPILVRPLPTDRINEAGPSVRFELICGERRFRATKMADAPTIPTMGVELTDEEVLELQIVENGQRADIHPMEEAESYEALSKLLSGKHSDVISEIAGRIGKTRAHIIRRMSLLSLPKSARLAFRKGLFTQETAMLIARIPNEKLRDTAADHIIKDKDLHDSNAARGFIEDNFMLSLANAPFDRGDAGLVPIAGTCAACPKRTGNQRTLFADVEKSDVCADPVCFSTKRDAHYARCAAAARAQGLEVLTPEASKKLFPHNDRLSYGSGYVMADSTNHEDSKNRTWKQLLGKNAPKGILARTASGAAVVLWDEREVKHLLKANPPKDMRAAIEANAERKEQLRSDRRKEAMKKETRLRTHAELLTRVSKDCKEQTFLHALIYALADVRHTSGFVGKITTKALTRLKYKSVNGLIEKGSVVELRSFVLECGIGDLAMSWKAQEAVPVIGGLLGVDIKAVSKTVQAEWDAKSKNRTKKK